MIVLVAYASRHGATAGIAERIARTLGERGVAAEAVAVEKVDDLAGYDAVVLGSAAYMSRWLRDATTFAKRHAEQLAAMPVWLFSSGPLGTRKVDKQGRDVREASRPREFAELEKLLSPRGEQVFFGAWDPNVPAAGFGERVVRMAPGGKEMLPAGDFRDWDTIDAWAAAIAAELTGAGTD